MSRAPATSGPPADDAASSWWGPLLVSLSACILTISIVGSVVYLGWRVYDRRQLSEKVRTVVDSLQNRTPQELADRATTLRAHPRLARFVLPEVARSIARSRSEEQLAAAIQVASAFLDDRKIVDALFRLRLDPRETVASAAVSALARLEPPQRAAEKLGECLADAITPAAIDAACEGLYALGEPGRTEMQKRLSRLSVERRLWLVKYVNAVERPHRKAWLEMLASDDDVRVGVLARGMLSSGPATPPAASRPADISAPVDDEARSTAANAANPE